MLVTSGVIQSCVVGPKQITVMFSDLPQQAASMVIVLCANDLNAIHEWCNQVDLNAIHKWSEANWLPLNLLKRQYQHFGHGNARHTYMLGACRH